ncbi:MAG: ATP synthase F0 subunit B [Planctomycetota bacterium]
MLDIQTFWFFILVFNFLGLIFILNIILFRPLLRVFKAREDTVYSSLTATNEMNDKKEEGIAKMNSEIALARAKAKEVFERIINEGLEKQQEVLSEAEASASAMLQQAREELRAEVTRAKQALKADIEKFSDEIVKKLVKA